MLDAATGLPRELQDRLACLLGVRLQVDMLQEDVLPAQY